MAVVDASGAAQTANVPSGISTAFATHPLSWTLVQTGAWRLGVWVDLDDGRATRRMNGPPTYAIGALLNDLDVSVYDVRAKV